MLKLLLLPFWLLKKAGGIVVTLLKISTALVTGLCRFTVSRVIGSLIGGLAGALFGSKHVGIKIFPKKK